MNKEPCKHPFMSVAVMLTGNVSPCCSYTGNISHINDVDNLITFFKKNETFANLRKAELNGEWFLPGCETCHNNPAASRKQAFNTRVDKTMPQPDLLNPDLRLLDISFNNSCNMTCVMCNNSYSSAWHNYDDGALSKKNKWPVRHEWSMSRQQLDKIVDVLDDIDILEIKGGEPFFDINFEYFLDKISQKNLRNLEIIIMTNFACITDAHIDLLNKFDKLTLNISLDGTGDIFSWVRGYSFSDIETRLLAQLPKLSKHSIKINFTSSLYNINNIQEFYHWICKISKMTNVSMFINFSTIVTYPEYLNPLLLTDRTGAIEQIDSIIDDPEDIIPDKVFYKNRLNILRTHLLKDTISDSTIIEKFKSWNNYLVKMRGYEILKKGL